MWTWGHRMIKCKIRKTLVVSLLPLIWSFPSFKNVVVLVFLRAKIFQVLFELNSCHLLEEWPMTKEQQKLRSSKAYFLPLVILRQTWHKSLEWLHENKMNHTPKLKWTTTKSIIYLIKELPHAIWRSLARGPAGKHFNSHCGDAFIKITTTIPGLPKLICYKQS